VDGTESMSGLRETRPNCSLGRARTDLTEIELAFKALFIALQPILNTISKLQNSVRKTLRKVVKQINKIIKALNKLPKVNIKKLKEPKGPTQPINLAATITDRIGMLALSGDKTGEPKIIKITGSGNSVKVAADNETFLSAENLLKKYYYIDSVAPSTANRIGNQWYIYEMENVPFCEEDYLTVRGVNDPSGSAKILSPEGRPAKIISISWNLWNDTADIIYWENKLWTDNLQSTVTKNAG